MKNITLFTLCFLSCGAVQCEVKNFVTVKFKTCKNENKSLQLNQKLTIIFFILLKLIE